MTTATICHVLHSLDVGGAEVLAYRLARKLSDRFRFVFACLDGVGTLGESLRGERFTVESLGRKPGFDLRCVRRLASFVRSQGAAAVHAHQYTPFFYARAPGVFGRRPPVIFTEHGRWYPDFPRRKRILFNRMALRRCDRVFGVGEAVRQALIHNEGIPGRRVGVIFNGVDFHEVQRHLPDRAAVRRELRLAEDDIAVVQVARLDPLKDHATALRAMEQASSEAPQLRLFLVGEGPLRDDIQRQVRDQHLESAVRLLGLRSDVPRLLAAADIFLLSSISEGVPVTLIEAMAAGLSVVATRVGGVGEVVVDGETGVLAGPRDHSRLAAGLLRLAQDATLRRQMGQAGLERAQRLFSEQQMHAGYARVYQEIIDGHG
jgi:glycosyltransferase involved in cell wall biosynthesis